MAEYREAEEIITRVATAQPGDLDLQVNLLRMQRRWAMCSMHRLADADNADTPFPQAIEISRSCLAKRPDQATFTRTSWPIRWACSPGSEATLGHLEKARELYQEEFRRPRSFSPARANDWQSRRELAGHYAHFGTLNVRLGDLVEGQRLYDKCTELREQIAAERPGSWPAQTILPSYNSQGSMSFPQGSDPVAARQFHQKALDLLKKRAKDAP